MTDLEIERWCQDRGWTEPRQLEIGLWVAFPPGGVMETPLPSQAQKPKVKPLQHIADILIVTTVTIAMVVIAVVMSPLFIKPLIKRYRNSYFASDCAGAGDTSG